MELQANYNDAVKIRIKKIKGEEKYG